MHAENVKQGRFASAGWTHDGDKFAFFYVDIDVAQDIEKPLLPERIVAFEIFEFNHCNNASFSAQRLNWVYSRGSARRQPTREHADQREHDGYRHETSRIQWRYIV